VPAYSPPGGAQTAPDVNAGLGQSNRPLSAGGIGRDGFDLQSGGKYSAETIRGGQGAAYVVSGQFVPELHTARRGDTLWEISAKYYGNPYNWPRVWSYNRQVQNPHWIYPGDHIRLREPYVQQSGFGVSFTRLAPLVSPNTKFQRHLGYVLDDKTPSWGEIVGSPEDQMILSQEDEVYIQLVGEREYQVGQKLMVFEPRTVKSLTEYPLVWIRGIVQIDRYNPKTKMARARIIESLNEIHRGCRVAPFERNLDVVAPVRNKKTVQAKVVGALHPHEFYGQNQVVFIDRGTEDGLEIGNRLFVVQRADRWRQTISGSGSLTPERSIIEDDKMVRTEGPPDAGDQEKFPAETYGELVVLRARKKTATCLITASIYEIPRGATLIAREGY
jgi:LysM repeat protein